MKVEVLFWGAEEATVINHRNDHNFLKNQNLLVARLGLHEWFSGFKTSI